MNVVDYFQGHQDYFWQWEEDAEVVALQGGSTIAYRAQIVLLLNTLAPQGLPPFGSFLLALVAINRSADSELSFIKNNLINYWEKKAPTSTEFIKSAFQFLQVLKDLPYEYKTGERREIVLRTIFANCHNPINIKTSIGLASSLNTKRQYAKIFSQAKPLNNRIVSRDMNVLSLIRRKFLTPESIIESMIDLPKLEELEVEADNKNPSEPIYIDFVDELIHSNYTFEIGTLIKPIWAGFNIPIFTSHPSEQPLGGVSDLSLKGTFDKLLASEFANDDLVFMSRIVNNEALYLHREMPPVNNKLERVILLDNSLKIWGTPRILAFATYLAIAKHPKSLSESNAYLVGKDFLPIYSNNFGDIIDSLQKVDTGLHSGQGLTLFLEKNRYNKQLEIFYITTEEGLKYPQVQKQLADYHSLFKYIITTNKNGEINFYRNKNSSSKLVQTIRLPLEKLWSKKDQSTTNSKETDLNPEKNKSSLLLLLPTPTQIRKTMLLDEDVYVIANKCLFKRKAQWNQNNSKGWELLLENLVTIGNYELGKNEKGQILLFSFVHKGKVISFTNMSTLQRAEAIFHDWRGKNFRMFAFLENKFLCFQKNRFVYEFHPIFETGEIEIEKTQPKDGNFDLYPMIKEPIPNTNTGGNIFRNINSICINNHNQLFFNNHQLNFDGNNSLSFIHYGGYIEGKISASYFTSKKNEFWFIDQSSVYVDSNGYIKLKSSDKNIPEIYLSSSVSGNLGMATKKTFAGNLYYYNESLSQVGVFLQTTSVHKIQAIRIIRTYTGMGLLEVKNIVESAPTLITDEINHGDAFKMINELIQIDCKAKIVSQNDVYQENITVNDFYRTYIEKFIQHIINHAATN
jgi:ribosomal protein L7/L12